MKKIYIIIALVLLGNFAMAQTSVWHGGRELWTRGEGTKESPYLIENADQLAMLSYVVNKGYPMLGMHFKLTTDIDLNGSEDQPCLSLRQGQEGTVADMGVAYRRGGHGVLRLFV